MSYPIIYRLIVYNFIVHIQNYLLYIILEIIYRLLRMGKKLIVKLSWKNENTDAELIVYPEELIELHPKNY